jgi:hypothetical protein
MTREESLDIIALISSAWSQQWSMEEMESYAHGIIDADPECCTLAVLRAQRELVFRPSVAELLDYARVERRLRNEADPHNIEPEKGPRPSWVLRWYRARGNGDHRPFPQQANALRDQGHRTPSTHISEAADWVQDDEFTEGDIKPITIGRQL